jgi:hypothetical protein
MAVEESIKINIQANAEEFKVVSDILNKELGKLGKNFQILEGDINQASGAMRKFDSSSKSFNKGLMNISLILQDLPYGFRGIQNNLPALAQGFGLLYLAVSAVTAAMTYFVIQGDNMSKGTKKLFETFKDFVNGVVNSIVNQLYPAFKSITESIKYLWSMFGENIIYQFKIIWENLLAFLKIAGNILAQAFILITSVIKGDWKKFGEALLNIFKLAWNGIIQFLSFALKQVGNGVGGFVKIFNKDLGETILKSVDYTANQFSDKFKFAFKEVETAAKKIDVFALFKGKKKGKAAGEEDDTFSSDLRKENNRILFEIQRRAQLLKDSGQFILGETPTEKAKAAKKRQSDIDAFSDYAMSGDFGKSLIGKKSSFFESLNPAQRDAENEAIVNRNELIKQQAEAYLLMANTISNYVTNAFTGLWAAMEQGMSIGEALGGMFMDLVKQIAAAAMKALVFSIVLSLLPGASAVGTAANASKKAAGGFGGLFKYFMGFANGGIVSGPTMGLIGEYPGAQNNPEVVAPLDKLKDLMAGSGSGGTFVLKGQDLVLAMSRSEKSLNLRRG